MLTEITSSSPQGIPKVHKTLLPMINLLGKKKLNRLHKYKYDHSAARSLQIFLILIILSFWFCILYYLLNYLRVGAREKQFVGFIFRSVHMVWNNKWMKTQSFLFPFLYLQYLSANFFPDTEASKHKHNHKVCYKKPCGLRLASTMQGGT